MRLLLVLQVSGQQIIGQEEAQYLHVLSQITCPLKLGAPHISLNLPRAVSKLIDPRLIGKRIPFSL